MHEIIDWPVLQNLSEQFASNIKFVHIFGSNGEQVIVITNDDNVYSFGSTNNNGSLGLGHTNAVQEPTKIEELCQKQVMNLEFCSNSTYIFVLALTKSGAVFSWGYNGNGQLGHGNTNAQYKPINILALNDKQIVDIKCGSNHSVALSLSGDVYIWGHPLGSNPLKMNLCAPKQKIISIACGVNHTLALTDCGDVYYWGDNQYGQCGNGISTISFLNCTHWSHSPYIIDKSIAKIACGPFHNILLSTDGTIYCYGLNDVGQCGDGSTSNNPIPTKINLKEKFVDIGAVKNYSISVGLTENGFCYVWGKYGKQTSSKPIKVAFKCVYDALEFFSETKITFRAIPFSMNQTENNQNEIMTRISAAFDQKEFSDIAFKIGDQYIYAQKTFLSIVCNHFKMMFTDSKWIESNTNEITITDHSYPVYYAFIKYLYTGLVDIKPEDLMDLIELANYCLEEELKLKCVKLVKNYLTIDNVCDIYSSAVKYKSQELQDYCSDFLHRNRSDKSVTISILNKYSDNK